MNYYVIEIVYNPDILYHAGFRWLKYPSRMVRAAVHSVRKYGSTDHIKHIARDHYESYLEFIPRNCAELDSQIFVFEIDRPYCGQFRNHLSQYLLHCPYVFWGNLREDECREEDPPIDLEMHPDRICDTMRRKTQSWLRSLYDTPILQDHVRQASTYATKMPSLLEQAQEVPEEQVMECKEEDTRDPFLNFSGDEEAYSWPTDHMSWSDDDVWKGDSLYDYYDFQFESIHTEQVEGTKRFVYTFE